MSFRTSRFMKVEGFEIHFSEWGNPSNPAVFCWHGLTRNGRDFDVLASRLSESYYVVCPDVIGRGWSEWTSDPANDYCFAKYEQLAVGLIQALGIDKLTWIGTSMGGAIGIRAAGTSLKDRITHLVLNDIGAGPTEEYLKRAAVPAEGIQHILNYTANPPEFRTLSDLMKYYQTIYKTLGYTTDQEWMNYTENSARRKDNGSFSPDYDPRIVHQFHHPEDLLLWNEWDAVTAKVLLIRGELSDILPVETAEAMLKRGPGCQWITIAGVGHAPSLATDEQMEAIERFLNANCSDVV